MKAAKSFKKPGRPPKRNPMKSAISVKVPGIVFSKLKVMATARRIPVATMVRNWVIDQVEAKTK
jgi:hypothetical protein